MGEGENFLVMKESLKQSSEHSFVMKTAGKPALTRSLQL